MIRLEMGLEMRHTGVIEDETAVAGCCTVSQCFKKSRSFQSPGVRRPGGDLQS